MSGLDPHVANALAWLTVEHVLGLRDLEAEIVPCPSCGARLRIEIREELRSLANVAAMFWRDVTPAEIAADGGRVDAFGRVLCGVPYVFCFSCGFDQDASLEWRTS